MPTSTVENYLKAILVRSADKDAVVATGTLAEALGVTPGTITTMVKSIAAQGLSSTSRAEGVRLTPEGRALALAVLRKHRLVEAFLVRVLKMDWKEVHEEAEALEHAISDRVLLRIDAILGHPETDPHGDPIPSPTVPAARPRGGGHPGHLRPGQGPARGEDTRSEPAFPRIHPENGAEARRPGPGFGARQDAGRRALRPEGRRDFARASRGRQD